MLVEGIAVKECVLPYRRPDGSIFRELVPLETILDSAAGIAHLPLCLHHPDEKVTPDNVDRLGVGNVGADVHVEDGGFTRVHLAIRRRDAQDAVQNGTDELSLSYDTQVDHTPGVHPVHGPYDGIQRKRRYDHLALVDQARVGPDARIRVDGVATTVISGAPPAATSNQGQQQRARGAIVNPILFQLLTDLGVRTDGVSTDEAALALAARTVREGATARADAATTHKAALDAAHAERDAAKARADAAEAKVKALEDAEKARADKADRERLDGIATTLGLDPKAHADAKALRKAIAEKHLGGALRADATDAYVDVLVDLAAQGQQQRGDGREAGRQVWDFGTSEPARQDGQQPPPARQDGQGPKRRPTANEARLAAIEAARKARP